MRGRRLLAAIAYRALSGGCDEIVANSDSAAAELSYRLVRTAKITLARPGVNLSAKLPDRRAGRRDAPGPNLGLGADPAPVPAPGSGSGPNLDPNLAPCFDPYLDLDLDPGPGREFTILMIVDSDADRFKNWLASDLFVELAARIGKEYDSSLSEYPGYRFRVLNNRNLTDNQYMEIMEKVSSMGLSDCVAIESYSLAARTSCLERADLCLYHSGGRYFPYPVIEAMSLGIPALTDDRELAGRMAPELGELGRLADFENPGELVALILALMYDGGLREKAGRASQSAARRLYSFDGMASGIYNIYIRGLRI
jgi:glycosyltransferase involved in cell wall biosynthesis